MTRERAKELAPIFAAYGEGKAVQYRFCDDNTWLDVTKNGILGYDDIHEHRLEYRIKPEPVMRPMTRGEVLYKVTTTPGMVVRYAESGCGSEFVFPATSMTPHNLAANSVWAIIDEHGDPIDGWHRFEVEA